MNIQQNINDDFLARNNVNQFRHNAMNTVFEIFMVNDDKDYSSQAAHEVFKEIDLIENDLSKFLPNTDISNINSQPVNEKSIVGEHAFECLRDCEELFNITGGVFNVTIGRIINSWKENDESELTSQAEFISDNSFPLIISEQDFGIIKISDVLIDLGGYGKGYAIDKATELLKEWSIDSFMISGGNSSVLAYDTESRIEGWPISISNPENNNELMRVSIQNISISGSGLSKGHHIIDPRIQHPPDRSAAWAACESTAWSDALSTAFMILDSKEIGIICNDNDVDALLIGNDEKGISIESIGERFTTG